MQYFHVIQNYSQDDVLFLNNDEIEVKFHTSRFLEYSDKKIQEEFKYLETEKLQNLKNFPCVITFEEFKDFLAFGKILELNYNALKKEVTVRIRLLTAKLDVNELTKSDKLKLQGILKFDQNEIYRTHWAIKTDNIFELINKNTNAIFSNLDLDKLKILFPNFNTPLVDKNYLSAPYDLKATIIIEPDLIYIKSVSEFISEIFKLHNTNYANKNNREIFYRGHGNAEDFKLQPSLFREVNQKGKVYLKGENILYKELITAEPKSFGNDLSSIDVLTRMQHYGMPTRLLDISSNPLTALYFACENLNEHKLVDHFTPPLNCSYIAEHKNKTLKFYEKKLVDAEVVIISAPNQQIKYYDSDTVSCLANLAKLNQEQKDYLQRLILNNEESEILEDNQITKQYLHFIKEEKTYFLHRMRKSDLKRVICVKGKKIHERIIAQSGAFLLFGLEAEIDEKGNDEFEIKRIRIRPEYKANILKELDLLNINKKTTYPSMDNSAQYLKIKLEKS